ncbi:hypothetical protein [Rhodoplanes roseus]|uniref:Uncharacterized protein n=1 Tax=Rhodoplanes roseus TaxID=29409 RepID=A0A327KXA8_9BRAD|nr:hypothetical protein [Rhodoplanes roseus]RAI42931.1 hypothetical protein CH341_16995 [Rhodoplanes roseus]
MRALSSSDVTIVFIECLRCGHRGVIDPDTLARYGMPPEVTLAKLTRALVCQVCGSRATKAFRSDPGEVEVFLAGT